MVVEVSRIFKDGAQSTIRTASGLTFPRYVEIEVTDEPGIDVDFVLGITFDRALERFVVDNVHVLRRAPGQDVGTHTLQTLKVHEYLQMGAMMAIRSQLESGDAADLPPWILDFLHARAGSHHVLGPSDPGTFKTVAAVYELAAALNRSPAKAVQEQLSLTRATAAVWIRRAKDLGFLRPPGGGASDDDLGADFKLAREALDG